MKRILAIILVLVVFSFYFAFMQFRKIGTIELEGYALSSFNVAKNLHQDDIDVNSKVSLVKVKEFDSIYRQKDKYYVGENKKSAVNMNYPVYAKDNSRIWNYSNENTIINDMFEQENLYSNLFIASMNLYNGYDYVNANNDKYIFLSFPDSIWMNTSKIIIKTKTETQQLPLYSLIFFQENKIRFYERNKDTLFLREISGIDFTSEVEINQNKLSYQELLERLRLLEIKKEDIQTTPSPTETPVEENPSSNVPSGDHTEIEEPTYVKPEVKITNIMSNVYSMSGTLQIVDPTHRIKKSPTIEINYKNKTYLKKSFYSDGKIEITGLLPNTTFDIIGSYTYLNEEGKQIKKIFLEQSIQTLDIKELEVLKLSYKTEKMFPNKIMLEDLEFKNDEDCEVFKGIKQISIIIDKNEYLLSNAQIRKLKKKEVIEYQTPEVLKSNTVYHGKIKIYDVASNELELENSEFTIKTSKAAPEVKIEVTKTDITQFESQIEIKNPDNIYLNRLRYELYNLDDILVQEGEIKEDYKIIGQNLESNQIYKLLVYADYDLEDGVGNRINQLLKEIKVSTTPISSLGYIRVTFKEIEIKQQTANFLLNIDPQTTDERIISMLDYINISVIEKETQEVVQNIQIEDSEIEKLKSDQSTPINFNQLTSKTEYEIKILTKIKQGDVDYEINTLSNLKNFITLKQDAKVEIINSFTTENLIDFDVKVFDIDNAIESNRVLLEVRNSIGRLEFMEELKINDEYKRITLEKLNKNEKYTFKFTAEEYNIGYTNITFEDSKVISTIEMETTVGVYGKIEIDSLLSQITSSNLFDVSNIKKWKKEGSSNINEISNDVKNKIIKMSAKNGYANYSYYLPEYEQEQLVIKFSMRHTKLSNMQSVFLSVGGGGNHQIELKGLSTDWKEFEYTIIPQDKYFGFYINEISNNNTTTEVEIKDIYLYQKQQYPKGNRVNYSYHSSNMIFEDTVMKDGSNTMNEPDGTSSRGHLGNGYARITNFEDNYTQEFLYTGSKQIFEAPYTGKYKIELWGAQGGNIQFKEGGHGAYTSGYIHLNKGQKLYIHVGGMGGSNNSTTNIGGYNGGGYSGNNRDARSAGGGGATDIRLLDGNWNDQEGLASRIMVAAGGGGATSATQSAGNAGGLYGYYGSFSTSWKSPSGGTQNSPGIGNDKSHNGSFGYAPQTILSGWGGGGGGGYYAGATGVGTSGAGGSSYISGHLGCIAYHKEVITKPTNIPNTYTPYQEKNKYLSSLYINLYDTKNEIIFNDFYIQIVKDNVEEGIYQYDLEKDHKIETFLLSYELEKNSNYEVNLLIKIRNRYYPIDSINFKTDEEIRTIRNSNDFFTMHTNGTYLAINDIDLRSINRRIGSEISSNIDFQGHKLLINTSNSPNEYIASIGAGGRIQNLDLHVFVDSVRNYYGGITDTNSGTMSNIMITLEDCVMTPSQQISFLSRINYGIIENFVVNSKVQMNANRWAAFLTRYQRGTIRNGYLYGQAINAKFEHGLSEPKRIGALASYLEQSSIVENVYSLIDIEVLGENEAIDQYSRMVGNLFGDGSRGTVRNVYTYTSSFENRDLTLDPVIGRVGTVTANNVYYVNPNIYSDIKSRKLSKIALRNVQFQENQLNGDHQFIVEDFVKYGYFPHLKLNDSMPKQEYIEIPTVTDDDLIDIISIDDVKSEGKEALVTLKVHNPGVEEIKQIEIKDLSTKIISQTTENMTTTVVMKVSDPLKYVSKYFVKSIISSGAYGIPYTRKYEDNEKVLEIDLYREISSVNDWLGIKQRPSENYMITTDLDFKNVPNPNIGNFSGNIDGANHTFSNITSSNSDGILINNLNNGSLKNLYIEKIKKTNLTGYSGAIGTINQATVQNVHITDMKVTLSSFTGGISGRVINQGIILDSSVTNLTIGKSDTREDTRIGGLTGYLENSTISHSYTQLLNINVTKNTGSIYAIGGIAGQSASGTIEYCYSEGQIHSITQEIGGIVGINSGNINHVYSIVDIKTIQGFIGGIAGRDDSNRISNTLVFGNVYSSVNLENIHRTTGNTNLNYQNYAWENQKVNGKITSDTRGEILVSTEQLQDPFVYQSIIQLGDGFNYENIDKKILPKLMTSDLKNEIPNQRDLLLSSYEFQIKEVTTTKSVTDAYILLNLENELEYPITDLRIDDMEITEIRKNVTENHMTSIEVHVKPKKYYDSYPLSEITYQEGSIEKKYYLDYKIDLQFYKDLSTFEDFQRIEKGTYENYRLIADIDFSGKTNINFGITMNRLESIGEVHTLKNIKLSSNKQSLYLIRSINSNISNIRFENVEITSTANSGNGAGIIGFAYGVMSNIEFDNVKVKSPNLSKVGMIAINKATSIREVSLSNIEVSGNSRVGGLLGETQPYDLAFIKLNHVTVNGKSNQVGGMVGYTPYKNQYTQINIDADDVHVTTTSGNYAGIIYGEGSASHVRVKNSSISGNNYVGGISGNQPADSSIDVHIENSEVIGKGNYIAGLYAYHRNVLESSVKNVRIDGTSNSKYIGGVGANGGYTIRDCLVQDVEITGLGSYVGGIEGAPNDGSRYRNAIINTILNGKNYVGGVIGGRVGSSDLNVYDNTVNVTINVIGSGAGGVIGYYPNNLEETNVKVIKTFRNIVENSTITASYNAGGLIGQVDKPMLESFSYSNILAVNVNTIDASLSTGIVVGNSDISTEKIKNLKIYNQSKINGELASNQEILGITKDNYITASSLAEQKTYTNIGFSTGTLDFSTLKSGNYPIVKTIKNQTLVPLPTSEIRMLARSLFYRRNFSLSFPEVNVYSSGIDKINIEFQEKNEYLSLIIHGKEYPLTERVMTFNYNYLENVEFTLTDGLNSKDYIINKDDLRKTILTYENYYYYLKDGILHDNYSNKKMKGIHLYDHYLLTEDFKVIDLVNGQMEQLQLENLSKINSNPLFEFEYNNSKIKTYYRFAVIDGEKEFDKQIFVKNGKMTIVSSELDNKKDSVIVDNYNNHEYFIVLGKDHVLYSLKNDIHYPADFKNKNIVEMNNNLDNGSQMIMIKYEDGNVYGFSYRTGIKILDTRNKKDTNIWDYYKDSVVSRYEDTFDDVYSGKYQHANELIKQLQDNPMKEKLNQKWDKNKKETYITSYDPLKQIHEVYEVNNSIQIDKTELTSVTDNINSNYELLSFYKNTQSEIAGNKVNGLYIFYILIGILIFLFLILGYIFYRGKERIASKEIS